MKIWLKTIIQEFKLKNKRNKSKWIDSKKQKKVCATLNYIELCFVLGSTVTGCVSISAFASLVGIAIGNTSCAIGFKICAITAGIKKY